MKNESHRSDFSFSVTLYSEGELELEIELSAAGLFKYV